MDQEAMHTVDRQHRQRRQVRRPAEGTWDRLRDEPRTRERRPNLIDVILAVALIAALLLRIICS